MKKENNRRLVIIQVSSRKGGWTRWLRSIVKASLNVMLRSVELKTQAVANHSDLLTLKKIIQQYEG